MTNSSSAEDVKLTEVEKEIVKAARERMKKMKPQSPSPSLKERMQNEAESIRTEE